MARSKSSNRWLEEHVNDPYVKKAQVDGYRSRASYKLLELIDKDRLIRPGMTVLDLGSTPGGWSQVVAPLLGKQGKTIASDILPMDPIADVIFIEGDFTEQEVFDVAVLKPGANYVAKVFHGEGYDQYLKDMREHFDKVVVRKPDASRSRSREVYVVGKGFKS